MKRVIAASLCAVMALATVTPAAAQAYRYSEAYAPQQDELTATVNFRVPLGPTRERATYGLTLNAQRADTAQYLDDGRTYTPEVNLVDMRFDGRDVTRANVVGLDFSQPNLGYDDSKDPKDGKDGKDVKTWYWVGGILIVGAIIWAASDNGSNRHHSPSN